MYDKLRICSAAFLIAVAGASVGLADPPTAQQAPADDYLITSTRVGLVYLGMSMKQLRAAMPPPSKSSAISDNLIEAIWLKPLLHVVVRTDSNVVCQIGVYDDTYSTEGGLKVGETQFDMRAVLGKPDSLVFNRYPNQWDATYPDLNLYVDGTSDTGVIDNLTVGLCPRI